MGRRDEARHLAPVMRAGAFPLLWWIVVCAAAAVLYLLLSDLDPATFVGAGPALWLLVVFAVVAELRPVVASNRTDPDGVNLATAFVFAALLLWGIEVAAITIAITTLAGEIGRRKRAFAVAFNVAQYVLSYTAAAAVLVVGGRDASLVAPAVLTPSDLGLVVLAAAAYHLVNLLVVGTAIAFSEQLPWWAAVTDGFGWYTVTTGAVLALSPLVVVVVSTHYGFLPLLALPLYLLWSTAGLALARERSASTDPLTGLANRAKLELLVADAAADRGGALCLVDLDRFKEVNDTLGHATGDALLCAVAGRLASAVRDRDAVARLGGDEFVLLLDVADEVAATRVLERVARAVHAPFDIGGVRLEVEMSVGVALLPGHGRHLEELLRRADAAMYEAKSTGEVVRFFHPCLDRQTPSRLQLLADLRGAIEGGQLELHYQPQVSLPDAHITGVEALVRWRHPTRGLLAPGDFLPLAERTATMRLVTCAVLEMALTQQFAWRALGLDVPIAVNASLHDLADGAFADRVLAGLADHDLRASDLRVEITEDALAGDPERVLATLRALTDAGVQLSLDDFGTGHASLTRLKRIPVTEVKMDRQLVVDLEGAAPQDIAIVRSVLDLTAALGVRSVAEGVETQGQWDALVGLGCDAAQGWYLAPALAGDEATSWLLAHRDATVLSPSGVVTTDR
jgi:diguanylate cyclase (GGDEF)-like protein